MGIFVAWIYFDLFSLIQLISLQPFSWVEFDRGAQMDSWLTVF